MAGSKQVHLLPVERDGYQLVIVNNMHECLIYRDSFGLAAYEDYDNPAALEEVKVEPTGSLKLVARVPIPQMSAVVVANETIIAGTNIKQGWL